MLNYGLDVDKRYTTYCVVDDVFPDARGYPGLDLGSRFFPQLRFPSIAHALSSSHQPPAGVDAQPKSNEWLSILRAFHDVKA